MQNDIDYRLILASASPARRALLTAAGIDAEVMVSGVDESVVEADGAYDLSLALARMKARTIAAQLNADPTIVVLGCDSVLAFEGEVFGKPANAEEAAARWRRMRGRAGVLHTGHHLTELVSGKQAEAVGTTTVHFSDVTDAEIAAYVATDEPLNVAGAFTLDGRGGAFVERIEGDPGNVIGLSLPLLRRLLAEMGIPITALWRK